MINRISVFQINNHINITLIIKILAIMTRTLFQNFVLQYFKKSVNNEKLDLNNYSPKCQSVWTNEICIGNKRKVNIDYFNNIEF